MKKILILLITSILFISCDMEHNPISVNSEEYKNNAEQLDNITRIGDTIIAYTEGNKIYYKNSNDQYYNAYIQSGTDTSVVSDGYIIFSFIIILFIGMFLLFLLIETTFN